LPIDTPTKIIHLSLYVDAGEPTLPLVRIMWLQDADPLLSYEVAHLLGPCP